MGSSAFICIGKDFEDGSGLIASAANSGSADSKSPKSPNSSSSSVDSRLVGLELSSNCFILKGNIYCNSFITITLTFERLNDVGIFFSVFVEIVSAVTLSRDESSIRFGI